MKKLLYSIFCLTILFLPTFVLAQDTLPSPKGADKMAAMHNDQGIHHYNMGHWDVAIKHFKEAVDADKNFAQGHYNLAMAFHKAGKHGDATKHFRKAAVLSPNNNEIQDSRILQEHLK